MKPQEEREIPTLTPTPTHRREVRRLLREARAATLATVLDGAPYASLVTIATDVDGAPILLLSTLADHTRALQADARVSVLVDEARDLANPQTGARASVQGTARKVEDAAERTRLQRRFLARHPAAALYAGFGDFAFWRIAVERAHYVGGFARAVWVDGIVLDAATAAPFADMEEGAVAHMNQDHADAVALYASVLAGLPGEGWRLGAIDCDGVDLTGAESGHRLSFPEPLESAAAVRPALVEMARQARTQKTTGPAEL